MFDQSSQFADSDVSFFWGSGEREKNIGNSGCANGNVLGIEGIQRGGVGNRGPPHPFWSFLDTGFMDI